VIPRRINSDDNTQVSGLNGTEVDKNGKGTNLEHVKLKSLVLAMQDLRMLMTHPKGNVKRTVDYASLKFR
jgi:hypothetical protein